MPTTDIKIINDREGLSPNDVEWAFILDQFATPFEEYEIKFREQSRGNFAAYIDSRLLQARLDKVVGSNWETKFRELSTKNTLVIPRTPSPAQEKHEVEFIEAENARKLALADSVNAILMAKDYMGHIQPIVVDQEYVQKPIERANNYGKVKNKADELTEYQDIYSTGVQCDLIVFDRVRSDVGTPANTEPVKSSYSDALKRAAVQWGIGRYLYTLGFFTSQHPQLPEEAIPPEQPDFISLIEAEKAKFVELGGKEDPQAKLEFDLVSSRYSPLVSILQNRRVFMNLREINAYLESGRK